MPSYRLFPGLLLAAALPAAQAAGNVDAEFGDAGRRVVPFDVGGDRFDDVLAMDVASNGTVVLAGSARIDATHDCIAIARLLPNGTLDTTFSGDGRYTENTLCSGASIRIAAVRVDVGNRIVFAGSFQGDGGDPEFIVGRIKADGSGLDDSFGAFPSVGIATPSFGGESASGAAGLALQSDGKIVAVGYATTNFIGSLTSFAVARLDANGLSDGTFNGNGYQIHSWGTSINDPLNDRATAVAIQDDGKIVVAGTSRQTATGADFGVIRLNANGSFDTAFGGNGTGAKLVDFGGSCKDDIATAIAPRFNLFDAAGNGVVVAGTSCRSGADWDYAVAVLDANGQLDAGFDGDGRRTIGVDIGGLNRDVAKAVSIESIASFLIQPTHITLAGFALNTQTAGAGYDIALTRLNFAGNVDTSFGTNGRATFGPNLGNGNNDFGNTVLVRGRQAWVAGSLQRATAGDYDFGVLRLFANDTIFGSHFERR
ncbi:hypothetical protein [Tahibacter caeni]|uniref:hypothetical protein n=1 Tax=Tahibacter caeni TaxID=1453545 RepID=UPI0021489CE4|nr:hypothetical protein [Tahibacter caeni]